ncbi:MAG: FtsX-like permease family protein [Turicibacter sp.]|nr:FtsX-like permease family protein [Turicibacter sp.]
MILIKNGLRCALKKPVQFLSLVFFMLLSSFIFVSLEGATSSVQYFVDDFTNQTLQEDFFIVLSPPNMEQRRMMQAKDRNLVQFYESIIEKLEEEFNATFDGRFFRDVVVDDGNRAHTFRFIRETTDVNLTYVIAGELPTQDNEIAIFREYANRNGLVIGDGLDINGRLFTITAFIAVPDYIYPIFSFDSPLFTPKTQTIALSTPVVYDSLQERELVLYSGFFREASVDKSRLIAEIANFPGVSYSMGNQANVRISTIDFQLSGNRILAMTFSSMLLMMSVLVLILITKKRITAERVQIGVLKALGYKEGAIIASYLIYPVLASFVGALTGYFLGIGVAVNLANSYVVNFVVPYVRFYLTFRLFLQGVILPVVIITLSSCVILWSFIKGNPINLIQDKNHLQMPYLSEKLNKVLTPFSFETRFKYSLAFRNMGKLLTLFVVVFIASAFLVFGFLTYDVVGGVTQRAFGQANYRYEVKYSSFSTAEITEGETAFLRYQVEPDFEVVGVPFQLYGIDPFNKINPLYASTGENITSATLEGVLINEFISRAYGIEVGDEISFSIAGRMFTYPISGIVNHFNGAMLYMDINQLREGQGLPSNVFNGRWTNDFPQDSSNLAYVFSMEELEHNLAVGMEMIRVTLQIMVGVSVGLGSFMMIVITNFIIEENRHQISILKVMGYGEFEVSNMVLTIYFPFILAAYLLAILMVRVGIDLTMSQIASRLPFSIPTDFNLLQILVGATVVVFTYWLSIRLSKIQLNNISLQEVLKH